MPIGVVEARGLAQANNSAMNSVMNSNISALSSTKVARDNQGGTKLRIAKDMKEFNRFENRLNQMRQ